MLNNFIVLISSLSQSASVKLIFIALINIFSLICSPWKLWGSLLKSLNFTQISLYKLCLFFTY